MLEVNQWENEALPLSRLKGHLTEVLSGYTDFDAVIFGSTALNNELSPLSDIDVWLSGGQAAEEEVSNLLAEDRQNTHYPYHLTKASDYAGLPELELAVKFRVATTGVVVIGELPLLPEGYTENDADTAFANTALHRASGLLRHAEANSKAGVWSDGSFTRDALRLWLFAQNSPVDRNIVKNLNGAELIEKLAVLDPQLAELLETEPWNSPLAIQTAREIVDKSISSEPDKT